MTNPNTLPSTFGQWLKQLRVQHDLTQEALAERAYCSVQSIRAFEGGKRRPALDLAERLADVLTVAADQRAAFIRLARTLSPANPASISASVPQATAANTPTTELVVPQPALLQAAAPLIGRTEERQIVQQLFLQEQCRLVTLLGPGGIGKTRLALDLTATLAGHFADGVAFVSLAAINHPHHLPNTIAGSLNLSLQGAIDPAQQVNNWLAPRQMLLTLDNVEQLISYPELVAWVREVMAAAPRLHLLITSRERLRISGERVFELAGLPLPTPDRPVEQADAVRLFLERAQQVMADFVINAQNQAAISRICRLVEGMPLGIELAAAWVYVLTPQEIADEISRSLDFLALATRDMTPRHRSMRAVFDHSWKLLSAEERNVLLKLSIFRGGCTREAAQQVAAATLPVLAGLIDKSLLRKSTSMPTRYSMHELVRQYVADHLETAPNELMQTVVAAHAAYYHQLVREAERQIWGASIADAVNRLEGENDNLRAVLSYYLADPASVAQSVDLAGLLWRFWEIRGYIAEGREWLTQALQRQLDPPAPSRWLALHGAGNLASDQDEYAVARAYYQECLQLLQAQLPTLTNAEAILHTRYRVATTLTNLGNCALRQDELAQALIFSEEALTLQRQLANQSGSLPFNPRIGIAITTTNLARIKLRQDAVEQATLFAEESLALYRVLGDERGIGWNLNTLGAIAKARGNYVKAAALYVEAQQLFEKLADQADMITLYCDLGELAHVQGAYAQAVAHYGAGLHLAQGLGSRSEIALLLDRLSLIAAQGGDYAQALTLSEQSIALYRALDQQFRLREALQHRGDLAAALGDQVTADYYYGTSQRLTLVHDGLNKPTGNY